MELWRQCAGWLIQCRVLPENHRVTWDSAQVSVYLFLTHLSSYTHRLRSRRPHTHTHTFQLFRSLTFSRDGNENDVLPQCFCLSSTDIETSLNRDAFAKLNDPREKHHVFVNVSWFEIYLYISTGKCWVRKPCDFESISYL